MEHPLENRMFGAIIEGEDLISVDNTTLITARPVRKQKISVYVHSKHPSSPEEWTRELNETIEDIKLQDLSSMREEHYSWWSNFWSRSWVIAKGDDVDAINRAYYLQRFKNACAGRGKFPIKFNGSLFSVGLENDPDYMRWGSTGFWFQNERHIYWPMLDAGDFDLMAPWFKLYKDNLAISKYRTSKYFNHGGAHFPETILFWGSEPSGHYNWTPLHDRDMIEAECPYVTYYWQNGIEQTLMMLNYYLYTGDRHFANEILMPMAESIIDFYHRHYELKEGKLYISPSQALETWHQADNPTPELAGLRYTIEKLLTLPEELMNFYQLHIFKTVLADLPDVPVGKDSLGVDIILPAENFSKPKYKENPELYTVFPYRLYGVNKPDRELAIHTFNNRVMKGHNCWYQDGIQMAYL